MKKLNPEELCKKYNTIRQANQNRRFLSDEIGTLLSRNGFNSKIVNLMKKYNYFKVYKEGTRKYYVFPEQPIYVAQFQTLLTKFRAVGQKQETPVSESDINSAIQLLKAHGYRIQKEEGLDVKALQKEQPAIFEKYLILKEV